MSDAFLRLIAIDPGFVPSPASQLAAAALLREWLPDAQEVTVRVTDHVEFVDQGEDFERVSCGQCGIGFDDWSAAMTRAAERDFQDLSLVMPCCGTSMSLNDLVYELPAGFARFVLEATNPEVEDLSAEQLDAVSAVLGSPIRRIWAHY